MQPNALLVWQSFMVQKVGVTDLPPLKGISPPRFIRAREKALGSLLGVLLHAPK
jgi:hypothetical protein